MFKLKQLANTKPTSEKNVDRTWLYTKISIAVGFVVARYITSPHIHSGINSIFGW